MLRFFINTISFACVLVLGTLNLAADRPVESRKITVRSDQKPAAPEVTRVASTPNLIIPDVPIHDRQVVERSTVSGASVRATRYFWMEVTAYCPCRRCCGPAAHGVTASGLPVTHNDGRFAAADTRVLPFGSKVVIPGYQGSRGSAGVPIIDRGGAIKGNRLDVFFPTHDEALNWGRRMVLVGVDD
ncbi:MAG: 3D domain-containing protein [Burkholderiales bacterium]|nr:3D domain-containing protein [Phycisphaerae bacterium]